MNLTNPSTWRVLVVDDEVDSVEVVDMVLSSVGAVVYQASNGKEGLAAFNKEHPDIVLTDISMPEVDGLAMLKEIRGIENGGGRTPIIALTAHAMVGDKDRILAAGFDGYLAKPLHMTTLVDDVIMCLVSQKGGT